MEQAIDSQQKAIRLFLPTANVGTLTNRSKLARLSGAVQFIIVPTHLSTELNGTRVSFISRSNSRMGKVTTVALHNSTQVVCLFIILFFVLGGIDRSLFLLLRVFALFLFRVSTGIKRRHIQIGNSRGNGSDPRQIALTKK